MLENLDRETFFVMRRALALYLRLLLVVPVAACALAVSLEPGHAGTRGVAVSIKPIHSLIAGVMRGVGSPDLIISGTASPHAYALKPSQARALRRARLVFWVGPNLESVLVTPLKALTGKGTVISLVSHPKIRRLALRTQRIWANGKQHGAQHGHNHGGHDHGQGIDPHIWLDPKNAQKITQIAGTALSRHDPSNKSIYAANVRRQLGELDRLLAAMRQTLGDTKGRPFIVFHDAFQYLEDRLGLTSLGAISLSPDRQPGPRQLSRLRTLIRGRNIGCVFQEPQFPSRIVAALVRSTTARIGVLDPIGSAIAAGPDHYSRLMRTNAKALSNCLNPGRAVH